MCGNVPVFPWSYYRFGCWWFDQTEFLNRSWWFEQNAQFKVIYWRIPPRSRDKGNILKYCFNVRPIPAVCNLISRWDRESKKERMTRLCPPKLLELSSAIIAQQNKYKATNTFSQHLFQLVFFFRRVREFVRRLLWDKKMVNLLLQTAAFGLNIVGGIIMIIAVILPSWKVLDVQVKD